MKPVKIPTPRESTRLILRRQVVAVLTHPTLTAVRGGGGETPSSICAPDA